MNYQPFCQKVPGQGAYNFILIHNAGGDHNFFFYQIDTLKAFGNIYLLDLPGHGKSVPQPNNRIEDSANIIESIIKEDTLEQVILIGLNNGANIAIESYQQNYQVIEKLILIDPPLFLENHFIQEIKQFIHALDMDDGYEQFVEKLVCELLKNSTEKNKNIARTAFLKVDKPSLQQMFTSLIEWDKSATKKVKNINCPVLCILTDEHHCSFNKLKLHAPTFSVGKVIGSKCWATLEVPEQINAMLERYIGKQELLN
ncbi:alpha/beta hydrolase [Francisellaceae bacterium]|nr:alpha/beta hydrolase [Francisellaceae bacterium]